MFQLTPLFSKNVQEHYSFYHSKIQNNKCSIEQQWVRIKEANEFKNLMTNIIQIDE